MKQASGFPVIEPRRSQPVPDSFPLAFESFLATIAELLRGKQSHEALGLLARADASVELSDFDHWNGGTYTWSLRLEIELGLLASLGSRATPISTAIGAAATKVFDAYDNHVWGIEPDYSQDQVGAVSLLARMEVAGMDVGSRWEDVAARMKGRATDTIQPFLTLQYLYGLARAERDEATTLMQAVEDRAAGATGFDAVVWREVALPAARGMLAHARGDFAAAARWLSVANPRLQEIGGSHAQRDLFGQLLLDAHMKTGNWQVAQQMLEMRRTWDPDGVPLARMLAEAEVHRGEAVA